MKRVAFLLAVAALAGCGGGSSSKSAGPGTPPPHKGKTLYTSNGWTVTLDGDKATLWHFVGDRWVVDNSRAVKITILGPQPNQVAIQRASVALTC